MQNKNTVVTVNNKTCGGDFVFSCFWRLGRFSWCCVFLLYISVFFICLCLWNVLWCFLQVCREDNWCDCADVPHHTGCVARMSSLMAGVMVCSRFSVEM